MWVLLRLVFVFSISLAGARAVAQDLPPALQEAWRATQLPDQALSILVRDVDGAVVFSHLPDTPRNPASVMKLVTTWAGLSGLGSDYVWRTRLLAHDGWRVDTQGRLSGALYVQAAGDPWMTVQDLWTLLRELRLRGVRRLDAVVVDRSRFGDVTIYPGDFDQSPDRPYNASPDAMMVGLGATRLLFSPDQHARQWLTVIDPPVPGVRVRGEIAWQDAQCTGTHHASAQVQVNDAMVDILLDGAVAGTCGEFVLYRLVLPQPAHFALLFQMLWQQLGGELTGVVRDGRIPQDAQTIVWHDSRPLAETIRVVNKLSNNVMARHLLLTLAAEMGDTDTGATAPVGARAALALLQQQKVDTRGWVIDNGSGLSREGRLTATGLVDLLQIAWRSPVMPEFVSSLAVSGVDGTVRKRMRERGVRGRAHVKTGSLRGARAMAGYVLGANAKRFIVVSLVNHAQADNAQAFHDALIRWLATRQASSEQFAQ